MSPTIDWPEIFVRLALATFAGWVLGFNRSERGSAAGLRTNMLVCLTAAVSMIQVNLFLGTIGKAADSFVVMDLMRLPLGILTGMGFIGAGAILRHRGEVSGVTTAATLWLGTTLGLCFGGGQYGLGIAGLLIGFLVLWALKKLEEKLKLERRGILTLIVEADGPTDEDIHRALDAGEVHVAGWSARYQRRGDSHRRVVQCRLRWTARAESPKVPAFVRELVAKPGVTGVKWQG